MFRNGLATAVALFGLCATPAFAQYAQSFTPSWYLGAGVGRGNLNKSGTDLANLNNATIDDNGTTFTGRVDTRPAWLATELGYYDLGDTDFERRPRDRCTYRAPRRRSRWAYRWSASCRSGRMESSMAASANGRSALKANGSTLGFVANSEEKQNEATYGVGAKWYFNRNWGIFAVVMRSTKIEVDSYLAGQVRFRGSSSSTTTRTRCAGPRTGSRSRRTPTSTFHTERLRGEALLAAVKDADAIVLIRDRTPFKADLIAKLPKLKLFVFTGRATPSSTSRRSPRAASRSATPTMASSKHSTAEMTWTLILAAAKRLEEYLALVRRGEWRDGGRCPRCCTASGWASSVSARSASWSARVGHAFGMEVVTWSPHMTPERAAAGGAKSVSLEELLVDLEGREPAPRAGGGDAQAARTRSAWRRCAPTRSWRTPRARR